MGEKPLEPDEGCPERDPLPGGPEDDEPDKPAVALDILATLPELDGEGGSTFMYWAESDPHPATVEWRPPGGSHESVLVTRDDPRALLLEVDGARWWRIDYRASDKTYKVSDAGEYAVLVHFDGSVDKCWSGVA